METSVIGILVGLSASLLIGVTITLARMNVAVVRMEKKLDALLKHSEIDIYQEVSPEIQAFARAGQKIEAIKLYRKSTGAGLAEAKAVVEALT